MKKIKCKKCGREISLGVEDEDRILTCCGQPMVEVKETVSCKIAKPESARSIAAGQFYVNFMGTQER